MALAVIKKEREREREGTCERAKKMDARKSVDWDKNGGEGEGGWLLFLVIQHGGCLPLALACKTRSYTRDTVRNSVTCYGVRTYYGVLAEDKSAPSGSPAAMNWSLRG
jgi:hypothetical protein